MPCSWIRNLSTPKMTSLPQRALQIPCNSNKNLLKVLLDDKLVPKLILKKQSTYKS